MFRLKFNHVRFGITDSRQTICRNLVAKWRDYDENDGENRLFRCLSGLGRISELVLGPFIKEGIRDAGTRLQA